MRLIFGIFIWICFSLPLAHASPPNAVRAELTSPALFQTKQILILNTMNLALLNDAIKFYQQQLQIMLPEQTLSFTVIQADANPELGAKRLANALATHEYDLIVSVATLATKVLLNQADQLSVPMQFMVVADPVSTGIIDKLGQTSTNNITGTSHVIAADTKLQLMQQILSANPRADKYRIGLVYSDYPSTLSSAQYLLEQDENYPAFSFVPVKFNFDTSANNSIENRQRFLTALAQCKDKIDGYWIPPGPAAHDVNLFPLVQRELNLPQLFSEDLRMIKRGALFGVLSDSQIIANTAAIESKQILSGRPANTLPIDRSDAFVIGVNTTTALAHDLVLPSAILTLANQHVYTKNEVNP